MLVEFHHAELRWIRLISRRAICLHFAKNAFSMTSNVASSIAPTSAATICTKNSPDWFRKLADAAVRHARMAPGCSMNFPDFDLKSLWTPFLLLPETAGSRLVWLVSHYCSYGLGVGFSFSTVSKPVRASWPFWGTHNTVEHTASIFESPGVFCGFARGAPSKSGNCYGFI